MANRNDRVFDLCDNAHYCYFACGFVTVKTSQPSSDENTRGIVLNVWDEFGKRITPKFRRALVRNNLDKCFGQNQKLLIHLDGYYSYEYFQEYDVDSQVLNAGTWV